jgi:inositol-phosphate phosphatase/L-galactose 1-phosphate phosphatase/histidinol-phosphatase
MEVDIELIDFAEFLADEARKITRLYFRSKFLTETKPDQTPVTEADKKIEETLRKLVAINFSTHGFIGEEFENSEAVTEYTWVVDPIDGTKSFLAGRPLFGTLIALCRNGVPVLGIIDQAILNERYMGVNGIAKLNNTQISASSTQTLAEAVFATTNPFLFSAGNKGKIEDVANQSKAVVYGGDCYNYAGLASGSIDVVIESGLKPYDFCALAPIITAAGGVITDFGGKALTLESNGNVIAASSKALHEQILALDF